MNFLNFIFMVTCYPILFVMYFMFRNAKDRNGYCFGATLSKELKDDPAVEMINMRYRKVLKNRMIISAVIPLLTFFIPYMSIGFTVWMIWICFICFYPEILFAKANKQIQELKKERGWEQVSEITYTDLKIASVPRKVKIISFLPALALSVIPVVWSYVEFQEAGFVAFRFCMVTFAVCSFLFYLCAIWTDKQKISVISEDSDTNMNFARAKKQIWKNFWLICIWANTIFIWFVLIGMYFRNAAMAVLLWGSVIYGAGILFVALWLVKKIRSLNQKYESKRTVADAADDDRYWPYGILYYNPNDTHVFIENRMGTGTAMNMATGVGKGSYIFAGLCLLIIPVSCIWLIMLDFTPIRTEVVDDAIVCTHLKVEYEIPLDEIESYTVLTEMPDVTKINGNGMDKIHSGTFEIYREGLFEAFYNPQNHLFIRIETDEETYYISGVDDAATQDVLKEIQK